MLKATAVETAWAFTVVSSEQQSDTIRDQEAWATAAAHANNWTITRSFSGVSSGKDGTRKLLEDLLAELRATPKARRPRRVLMIRIDRLGRGNGLDAIGALAQIHRLGVIVHTRDGGDVEIKRASDAILPAIQAITAALENDVRSEKWKAVHARRRAAGLHVGQVPFGVILVDGRATPFEPEAAIVRDLFEFAASGWGFTRLAKWARERLCTKRMPDGTDRPYRWAPSSVRSLLRSPTIRGLVVDEELFQRASAARAADFRARAPKRWPWPLAGSVRCVCGRLLRGHTAGAQGWESRYYICFDLDHGRPYPAHRADRLEDGFIEIAGRLAAQSSLYLEADFGKARLESLREAEREGRRDLERSEARRRQAWALAEEGALSAVQLKERLDEVDDARRRANMQIDRAQADIGRFVQTDRTLKSVADVLGDLPQLWSAASIEQKQELARAVAALPEVDGLWADPIQRHVLLAGCDLEKSFGAKGALTDDAITKKFIQSITE